MEDSYQNEKMCRLCLMKCDKYEIIDKNIRNNLDVLLLNTNLLLIEEPTICKSCADLVKKCFYFKTKCLDTHKYIVSCTSDKSNIKIDLRNIYFNKKENATDVLQDSDVCGFCMGLVKSCLAVSLDNTLQKMFEKCFPEMDFSIVNNPIICALCHGRLKEYFSFVMNCLLVEKEIGKYCESLDIEDNKALVDLTCVLQFMVRNKVVSGEDVNTIDKNKEEKYRINPEYFYQVGEHEDEGTTEVDDQKLNNLLQFPLHNVNGKDGSKVELQGKFCHGSENIIEEHEEIKRDLETIITTEDYKYDNVHFSSKIMPEEVAVIKKEWEFVEEQTIEKNENYVVVEDQKLVLNDEIQIKADPHDICSFQSDSTNLVTSGDLLNNRNLSKLDYHSLPSEALFSEVSREYKNDAVKHESIIDDPLVQTFLQSESTNPSNCQMLTPELHSDMSIYQCESCSFQTKYESNLAKHSCMSHENTLMVQLYRCELCPFETIRSDSLKTHSLVHKDPSEVTMYQCESCSFRTKRQRYLKLHLLIHRDPSKLTMYQCESCPFQSKRKEGIKRHLLVHKDPLRLTMYQCKSCPFQTKHKGSFKNHSLVHKDPLKLTMYQCKSCPFQTKRIGNLKAHSFVHEDPSRVTMYQCESCPFQTKHKNSLKLHLLLHKDPSEVAIYQCGSCSFQTKRKDGLKRHFLVHSDPVRVKMYQCELCTFETRHKVSLKKHSLVHKKPLKVTVHRCDSCPFQTKRSSSLKAHSFVHEDPAKVTMFQCESCPFQTKRKCGLKQHSLVHKDPLGVTMYQCELCPFQTKRKGSFNKHSLVHKDPLKVTMHQCKSCPFQTKRMFNLRAHSLVHKDPKKITMYQCGTCAFQTKRKDGLKQHLLVHTDPLRVTMYQCELCAFQSKYKDSLKKHSLVHKDPSEIIMYKCESCPFQTKRRNNLRTHSLVHKDPLKV